MKNNRGLLPSFIVLSAAILSCPLSARESADAYPSKPVRIISPQATGGTDVQARVYAEKLFERFGRQFIVENRPGAGNTAGPAVVAKSAPDGYTLLVVTPSFTFSSALYNVPYDAIRDFTPISLMNRAPYFVFVNPAMPAKSIRELIALGRANPGKLNWGGGATGSSTHLAAEWFCSLAKIKMTYVPYKGAALATTDLLGGYIDVTMGGTSGVPHWKAGRLRALGVSTLQRFSHYPDLPTIAEQGVPGYEVTTFHGWAAPAGTPPAIINKLSAELARIARMPDVVERVRAGDMVGSTPEEFSRLIAAEIPRLRKIVKDARITITQE